MGKKNLGWPSRAIALGLVGMLLPVSGFGQIVRGPAVDHAGRRMSAQLMLPAPVGESNLFFMCDRLALMSASLPAAGGGMTLKWRIDAGPLHEKRVGAGPMFTFVEAGTDIEVRRAMRSGTTLTVRLESSVGDAEIIFAYGSDSRASFAMTTIQMGVDKAMAEIGYDYLSRAIASALEGTNQPFADWSKRASISLKDGERAREAWEIMPQVLDALHAVNGTDAEDAIGTMTFGPFWTRTTLKNLGKHSAASYREKNGSINDQLDWLAARCRVSGYTAPLP
jgi:hypothetical protein